MKKILFFTFALVAISFASCGNNTSKTSTDVDSVAVSVEDTSLVDSTVVEVVDSVNVDSTVVVSE